jgi:hypothetical protein
MARPRTSSPSTPPTTAGSSTLASAAAGLQDLDADGIAVLDTVARAKGWSVGDKVRVRFPETGEPAAHRRGHLCRQAGGRQLPDRHARASRELLRTARRHGPGQAGGRSRPASSRSAPWPPAWPAWSPPSCPPAEAPGSTYWPRSPPSSGLGDKQCGEPAMGAPHASETRKMTVRRPLTGPAEAGSPDEPEALTDQWVATPSLPKGQVTVQGRLTGPTRAPITLATQDTRRSHLEAAQAAWADLGRPELIQVGARRGHRRASVCLGRSAASVGDSCGLMSGWASTRPVSMKSVPFCEKRSASPWWSLKNCGSKILK